MKTNCAKLFPLKSIGGTYFSVGNLATDHFSGKLIFERNSPGYTGSNDIVLEFLSCQRLRKKGGHTHTQSEISKLKSNYVKFFSKALVA
jgi:hypothetical protein